MIDNFCSDSFWNINQTWNAHVPDFSTCFQDVALVLIPSTVFSVIGIINLFIISRYTVTVSLPWRCCNTFKFSTCILLLILSLSWCGLYLYEKLIYGTVALSTITASFSRSVVYVVVLSLMFKHRSHGIPTSRLLSVFWICFTLAGIIMHRSIFLNYSKSKHGFLSDLNISISMVYYPFVYAEFLMTLFVDKKDYVSLQDAVPEEETSFLSEITFLWFNKIVHRSRKRLLMVKDFLPLPITLRASYLFNLFSKSWKFHLPVHELEKQYLSLAVLKSIWPWLLVAFILDFLNVFLVLSPPLILDHILRFVKNDQYLWRKYFYCVALFLASFGANLVLNNCFHYVIKAISQIRSCLTAAVYRKNLLLSSSKRKDFTSGSITSLISVDAQRISMFAFYLPNLIVSPLKIILIIYLVWQYLGPATFAGVGVIILLIPITLGMSRISKKLTERQMMVKDTRLKYLNEILSGIKILKFYAWEEAFSERLSKIRKEEIKMIRYSQYCFVVMNFVIECAPIVVSVVSFATYVLINPANVLTPTRAFVSLSLMDTLRGALFMLPAAVSEFIQTITSLNRIKNFLVSEEYNMDAVDSVPDSGDDVTFRNATLMWSEESNFYLKNIDLHVNSGKLVAVIGPVGCGKSSLMESILCEMHKLEGSISVKGSIAYVPQEAWILNRTLKNNILLDLPMDEKPYNNVLDCCCLRPDLEILPAKDETEIGEKGINLSGGQKQRVSLARAVYQNRDIYLLDDPLSALDSHVRKAVFDDVISSEGVLKNKTRILVTHDISVLPHVDLIVCMNKGEIVEIGSYSELCANKGSLSNFIQSEAKLKENHLSSGDMPSSDMHLVDEDSERNETAKQNANKDHSKKIEATDDDDDDDGVLIRDEKMEKGGVKRFVYFSYFKHSGLLITALALLAFISYILCQTGSSIWLSMWTSDSTNGTQSRNQTFFRLSVYAYLGGGQAISIMIGVAFLVYGATSAADLYHKQMLDKVLKSPMSFFDTTPLGRIVNRFSTDMDSLDIHIVYSIDGVIECVLYSLAVFVVIGMNAPLSLVYSLPLGVIYFIISKLHLNASRQIKRLESTTKSPLYSHLVESINGVLSIKAYKIEKNFIEKFEELLDINIASYYYSNIINRWLRFWVDIIGATVIAIAAYMALENRFVLGASVVALVISYSISITKNLAWTVRTFTDLETKSVCIERIEEYCHLPSEAPWYTPGDPDDDWPESGEILFNNYSTRYRENLDLVLKEINLNVHSNEKVGVVGRTGAGKSSLTLALFRIIEPANGTIVIDNVDISQIGLHSLRSKLTIIPQDPILFTGSLRFNLDPIDKHSDEEIWTSLTNSHLKDFVSNLPQGLEFNVEEGGANLSAGQKQLLCLSRALLKKSKILVLDEATAAVDVKTDRLIQETIAEYFAKHTIITIAHRINTIMDYDKIVVMNSGEVVEVGNPKTLLQNKESWFFSLANDARLA